MKKILALILAALMILCFVACSEDPAAEEEENGKSSTTTTQEVDVYEKIDEDSEEEARKVGVATYELDEDGHYEIVSYRSTTVELVDIVLPENAPDDREIVAIGNGAFEGQTRIRSVVIPETYETIGDLAFALCDGLVSVEIKGNVTSIGDHAFQKCTKLVSINGTTSVTTVGAYAFSECASLKAIDLSDAVKVINKGAFHKCTALTTVKISNDITHVEKSAFQDCSNLKYETYDNANYLGNSSNKYVALITASSLNIADCVINDKTTVVAKDAFSNCKYLKTVTVGEKVTVIGSECFVNTPELEYNVYEDVSYLGTKDSDYAIVMFANVPSATGIELHEDVKMITRDAFSNCINLTDIDCSKLTKAEWNDVYKINGWDNDLTIKVICSDGNIE